MIDERCPEISVILPTCNRAPVLERAIRSVLAQTFTSLELIVVDDGSTDNSKQLVQGFDDPRISYIRKPGRGGAAAARNLGVRSSRARLLAFQDSDDEWTIDKLRSQYLAYERARPRGHCLVCGSYIIRFASGRTLYMHPDERMRSGDWAADNIYDFRFITPTWLMPKTTFEALGGFDESMPNLEDRELVFRLFSSVEGAQIIALDEPLVIRHGSADGINPVKQDRLLSLRHILARHGAIWSQQPQVLARLYDEIARIQCQLGDVRAGRQSFVRALRLDASPGKRWLHWLAALFGARCYQWLHHRLAPR